MYYGCVFDWAHPKILLLPHLALTATKAIFKQMSVVSHDRERKTESENKKSAISALRQQKHFRKNFSCPRVSLKTKLTTKVIYRAKCTNPSK